MAESDLHKHIKYSIAKGLVELGYQSGVEVPTRDGGYIDVQGRRGNTYYFIAVPVPPFHYCCWAATPNYPMYTSLLSITEPYHHYPSISSVLRRTFTIINNA